MAVQDVGRQQQMINLVLHGKTLQEVGDAFGLSRERVRQIVKGSRAEGGGHANEARDNEIRNLYNSGVQVRDIAKRIGLSYLRVRGILGLHGWEISQEQRFWNKVIKHDDGCWEWAGNKTTRGYGRVRWNGAGEYAHRVSYMIHYGSIPDGMVVMHKCDNPQCTRPDHLQIGTQADNVRDRDMKGRYRQPSREKIKKVSDSDVLKIRYFYGRGLATIRDLSNIYGTKYQNVYLIVTGRSRKNVQ